MQQLSDAEYVALYKIYPVEFFNGGFIGKDQSKIIFIVGNEIWLADMNESDNIAELRRRLSLEYETNRMQDMDNGS